MGTALPTTDADFKKDVLESPIPVLVDFWAEWCGPCRMMEPVLEELALSYQGRLKVVKVNADENVKTAADFKVRGIPTFLFFKNGEVVRQIIGAGSKSKFEDGIQALLG